MHSKECLYLSITNSINVDSKQSSVRGSCPKFPKALECPDEPEHECKTDSDCASSSDPDSGVLYKCCLDGCYLRCIQAITHKSIESSTAPCLKEPIPLENELGGLST
ncbi:hypothetical protein AC249_AIPGENE21248 [Exaiptasia diaphana]|nr:hypothetical protein AC249_AIPGENE21248 [Exaiptasia diaphana]